MTRSLPPLAELRAFEAAARHASFKAAAAELGVTPAAISHQIKLLEEFCGQPLFRRRPRPIGLTLAGQKLFPVVRDGLDRIGEVLAKVRVGGPGDRLRVTATNAFAARWLVPRLPFWRAAHPGIKLDIVGTDDVLDLQAGEADVAIRYAAQPPRDGVVVDLKRDTFFVVASPLLVGASPALLSPIELSTMPLIETAWPPGDNQAPNWQRWQQEAGRHHAEVPDLTALAGLSFREELHAIEAAVAGQGVALCSDVLIASELASGALIPLSDVVLTGYGFYIVYRKGHPMTSVLRTFTDWACGAT